MTTATQHLSERIAKFNKSAQNARNATNTTQKQAAQGFLIKRSDELRAERDRLYVLLNKQTDWLDANKGSTKYNGFLDQWIETERDYRAVVDALKAGLETWLEPRDAEAA